MESNIELTITQAPAPFLLRGQLGPTEILINGRRKTRLREGECRRLVLAPLSDEVKIKQGWKTFALDRELLEKEHNALVLVWTEPLWSLLSRFFGLTLGLTLLIYGLWTDGKGESYLPYMGLALASSWMIGPWLLPRWTATATPDPDMACHPCDPAP